MAAAKLHNARRKFVEKAGKELIRQLLDDLLDDGVLNDGQKDSILEDNSTTADKARNLIDVVKKKGDKASEKFITHLESRDQDICTELGLSSAQPAQQAVEPKVEQKWSPTLISTTEDCWREKLNNTDIYPTDGNARSKRVALLITNINFTDETLKRNGADKDEQNMENLMTGLGYKVVKHRDLTAKAIDDALKEFSKHPNLKETDSVLVVLMSHGKRGRVLGVDCTIERPEEFPIDNIYKHLGSANCPALLNKPKIIIIQACRGEEGGAALFRDGACPDSVTDDVGEKYIEDDNFHVVNREKDFSSLLSCTADAVSYRSTVGGSFFIQYIVEVFNTYAYEDHIEELFRRVKLRFEGFCPGNKRQMPSTNRSTMTKHFYFFPGL